MKRVALLFWILLVSRQLACGQSVAECKQWLLDYQQSMARAGTAAKGRVMFAHMTVTTIPAKDSPYAQVSLPVNDLEVKMIVGDRYLVYESPHISLYRDEQESFTVVHPRKTIIRTPLPEAEYASRQTVLEKLPGGRPQFLEQCTVQACQAGELDGKNVQVITLKGGEEVRKKYGIERLVYYADLKAGRILKQETTYVPGVAYERQTIVYHQFEPNYRHKKLPSATYVLAGKQLLGKYRHYTLE